MPKKKWDFSRKNATDSSTRENNPFKRSAKTVKAVKTKPDVNKPALKNEPQTKHGRPVFVSYARRDLPIVQPYVEELKQLGVNIVWDQDFPPGVRFDEQIRQSISGASAVIVVWGPASISSEFVLDEATLAKRDQKLLPVIAGELDVADIPLGFGRIQTMPLSDTDAIRHALAGRGAIPAPPSAA